MRAVAKDATEGIGPDVAFEVVGRSELQRAAHDVVRTGGRAVLVGMPRVGDDPTFKGFEQLFFREKAILPSYYGSCDPTRDVPRLLALWRAGRLKLDELVTATRPLSEAAAALDELAAGEAVRTVLVP
jgi:Zn-dependent alcohol dehydrogenase